MNVEIQIVHKHDLQDRVLYYWQGCFPLLSLEQAYSEHPLTMVTILNNPLYSH